MTFMVKTNYTYKVVYFYISVYGRSLKFHLSFWIRTYFFVSSFLYLRNTKFSRLVIRRSNDFVTVLFITMSSKFCLLVIYQHDIDNFDGIHGIRWKIFS